MSRETNYKISQGVEKFLNGKNDVSKESLEIISNSVRETLKKSQGRIAIDFSRIASKAGKELSEDLSQGFFELANNTWYDRQRNDMMLVPDGTVFLHRQGSQVIMAIQQRAQLRTINYRKGNGESVENFRIALPFCLFIFNISEFDDDRGQIRYKIDGGRLAFLKQPLTNLNQTIYVPCLPNIDTTSGRTRSLKICQGESYHPDFKKPISELIAGYINHFWTTPFGKDWSDEFEAMSQRDGRFEFKKWAELSKTDPIFVIGKDVAYREAGRFCDIVQLDIQPDNKLNAPLRRLLEKAVARLSELAVNQLAETEIIRDYTDKIVDKAVHSVMCSVVRECVENVTQDLVVVNRGKFASEQEKLEAGLNDLLVQLKKKVGSESESAYWGS